MRHEVTAIPERIDLSFKKDTDIHLRLAEANNFLDALYNIGLPENKKSELSELMPHNLHGAQDNQVLDSDMSKCLVLSDN